MPDPIEFEFHGLTELQSRIIRVIRRVPEAVIEKQKESAEKLLGMVREHASGRPGPNVITGAYRSSWRIIQRTSALGRISEVDVTTDHPAAARLEYGFVGTDSLGRHYAQPPFPHIRPAMYDYYAEIDQEYADVVYRTWEES